MKFGHWPCPQCRKPSSVLATRCPHCTVPWTKEEIDRRSREFWIAFGLAILLVAGVVLWVYLSSR